MQDSTAQVQLAWQACSISALSARAPPPTGKLPLQQVGASSDRKKDASTLTHHMTQVARAALVFCLIWFTANYTFDLSLLFTTVSSNTIISSTSGSNHEMVYCELGSHGECARVLYVVSRRNFPAIKG
jgi:hypothetical protein